MRGESIGGHHPLGCRSDSLALTDLLVAHAQVSLKLWRQGRCQ